MAHPANAGTLRELAKASGWTIPEWRMEAIAAVYEGIAKDTLLLRETDLTSSVPPTTFEAE